MTAAPLTPPSAPNPGMPPAMPAAMLPPPPPSAPLAPEAGESLSLGDRAMLYLLVFFLGLLAVVLVLEMLSWL